MSSALLRGLCCPRCCGVSPLVAGRGAVLRGLRPARAGRRLPQAHCCAACALPALRLGVAPCRAAGLPSVCLARVEPCCRAWCCAACAARALPALLRGVAPLVRSARAGRRLPCCCAARALPALLRGVASRGPGAVLRCLACDLLAQDAAYRERGAARPALPAPCPRCCWASPLVAGAACAASALESALLRCWTLLLTALQRVRSPTSAHLIHLFIMYVFFPYWTSVP